MTNSPPAMLDAVRRPLNDKERRAIRAKIGHFTATQRRALTTYLPIAAGGVFVLWLWTILASDAPWLIVTAFWLVVGSGITLWVRRDMRGHAGHLTSIIRSLQSAVTRNEADVYDIRARSFATLEEIEDEGACYAFELDGDRLVFISGQEFYEAARFPSLDFSLVYPLDEQGMAVDMLIEKRGDKATAARIIPADVKRSLNIPDHLEVRAGRMASLERVLDSTGAFG